MNRKKVGCVTTALLLFATLIGFKVFGQSSDEGPLPQGPHVNLVYAKCQSCHNLKYVTDSAGLPPFLWEDTLDLMVQLGMQVTDEEQANLLEYLTTYLGPDGPPENNQVEAEGEADDESSEGETDSTDVSSTAEEGTQAAADLDGEALYSSNCSSCHQQNGQGVAGAFPPLPEHTPALYRAEGGREYLANLMLYGLQGEIVVGGETYNGVMPAWTQLSDAELAAILNHVLTAWGNGALLPEDFAPYTAEDLTNKRGQELSAQAMLERRPEVIGE